MDYTVNIVWLPRKNIGLIKEVDTLVELLQGHGRVEKYISSPIKLVYVLLRSRVRGQSVSLFVYNISAMSWLIFILARLANFRLVQFLHEPGMDNKLNYGYFHATKILLVELLLTLNVQLAHEVVTFSEQAQKITVKKFPRKNIHKVSLLPYAKVPMLDAFPKRRYPLIYIGTIHPAKNLPLFLDIAKSLFELTGCKSKLISRSTRYIKDEDIENCPYLDVDTNAVISDELIEQGLANSLVLFKMDKNMMQSGLIAQSMYFGTICILNNIKGFQQDFHPMLHMIFSADTDPVVLAQEIRSLNEAEGISDLKRRMKVCLDIHEQKLETWNELLRRIQN